jgi:hypothetical protein
LKGLVVATKKSTKTAKRQTKKKTPVTSTRKRTTAKKSNASQKIDRPFPRASLSEAIRVPLALKEYNGGKPWPPSELKEAIETTIGNTSVRSNHFYYLTASSRDFGLTTGTTNAGEIALTDLGRRFAYAGSQAAEEEALKEAFFSIPVFAAVYKHYGSSALPEKKYVTNTLENEFDLLPEIHDEFLELFRENVQRLKLDRKPLETPEEGNDKAVVDLAGLPPETTGQRSDLVVVAEPEGGTDRTLFVAIPFEEKTDQYPRGFFAEVLRSLIGPAGASAGFRVVTANRAGSDVIQSTIVNSLLDAELVLGDLTEHNPNVLFELGLRMAEDKPVALIRSEGTARIFDVDNLLRVFDYNPNLWESTIAGDLPNLTAHIRASWDRRDSDRTYMKLLRGQFQDQAPQ